MDKYSAIEHAIEWADDGSGNIDMEKAQDALFAAGYSDGGDVGLLWETVKERNPNNEPPKTILDWLFG